MFEQNIILILIITIKQFSFSFTRNVGIKHVHDDQRFIQKNYHVSINYS